MDNSTVVTCADDAVQVLGSELAKGFEKIGTSRRTGERAQLKLGKLMFDAGVSAACLVSPYTKGRGQKLTDEANASVMFETETGSHTWPQMFDAAKLEVAKGYCTPVEFAAYTAPEGETVADSVKQLKRTVTQKIGSIMGKLHKSVLRYETAAQLQVDLEAAQDAENAAAKAEGRDPKIVSESDIREPNGRGGDTRPEVDRLEELAGKMLKIVRASEDPEFDVQGMMEGLTDIYTALGKVLPEDQ